MQRTADSRAGFLSLKDEGVRPRLRHWPICVTVHASGGRLPFFLYGGLRQAVEKYRKVLSASHRATMLSDFACISHPFRPASDNRPPALQKHYRAPESPPDRPQCSLRSLLYSDNRKALSGQKTQRGKCHRLLLTSLAMALHCLAALPYSGTYRAALNRLGTLCTALLPNWSRGAPLSCDSGVTPRQLQRHPPADQPLAQPLPRPSDRSGCDTRWPGPSRAAVRSQPGRRHPISGP